MFRWKMLEGLPVIALFLGAMLSAAAQTTTTWVGGSGGEWDFAPHWDNGIPDGNFIARFHTPSDGKAVNIHRVLDPAEPFRLRELETGIGSGLLALFNGSLAFDQSGGGWISAAENSSIEMQNQVEFAGELEVRVAATNSVVRLNGNLTSSGSAFLRKTGGGRLRLFGDNSGMTGSETVDGFANVGINFEEGTITAGDGASLGTGRVRFAGAGSENVTLDLPEATFGNGLIFDHAGTGASRVRTPLGSAVTFTTTDIAGTSRITLTNDGTGSGLALFRFKGAGCRSTTPSKSPEPRIGWRSALDSTPPLNRGADPSRAVDG